MKQRRVVIALIALGCSDYTLVGPEANAVPHFDITAQIAHDEQLTFVMNARFVSGTDATGHPRTLSDSSLLVDGIVVPYKSKRGTLLEYVWSDTVTRTLAGPESLSVRGPVVADIPSSDRVLTLPLPTRIDPYRMDLPAGDDLRLNISPMTDSTAGLVRRFLSWGLQIAKNDERSTAVSVQGIGSFPQQFQVPWSWLGQGISAGDSLTADLQLFHSYTVPNAPFRMGAATLAHITWHLRIVAPISVQPQSCTTNAAGAPDPLWNSRRAAAPAPRSARRPTAR